jgi:TolA-binding protein
MKRYRLTTTAVSRACGVAAMTAMMLAFSLPAAAQSVTSTDIQRLQDQVYDASGDLSRMRSNPDDAARLQSELDDLRDEVVYLKVKLRKEGTVRRADFNEVQTRLQDLRSRARADMRGNDTVRSGDNPGGWRTNSDPNGTGTAGTRSGGVNGGVITDDRTRPDQGRRIPDPTATGSNNTVIPSGQEIDVRLESELSSATAQVEQRFQATTVADLYRGNEVLIPTGSVLRGVISSVTKTTRMERKGSVTVAFDQITIRGRTYPMRGTVTQALESEGIKGEAQKIGAGAGIGAIIGGIIGGVKGALLGVLIGGGGTIAATEGKDVTLPSGTILRVRLYTPPAIR